MNHLGEVPTGGGGSELVEGDIDHTAIQNVGTLTHAAVETWIGDATNTINGKLDVTGGDMTGGIYMDGPTVGLDVDTSIGGGTTVVDSIALNILPLLGTGAITNTRTGLYIGDQTGSIDHGANVPLAIHQAGPADNSVFQGPTFFNNAMTAIQVDAGRLTASQELFADCTVTVNESSDDYLPPILVFAKSRGAVEAPTAVNAGDLLFEIYGEAHDDVAYVPRAGMHALATENHSAAGGGTRIDLYVTPNGANSTQNAITIRGDGVDFYAGSVTTTHEPTTGADLVNKTFVDELIVTTTLVDPDYPALDVPPFTMVHSLGGVDAIQGSGDTTYSVTASSMSSNASGYFPLEAFENYGLTGGSNFHRWITGDNTYVANTGVATSDDTFAGRNGSWITVSTPVQRGVASVQLGRVYEPTGITPTLIRVLVSDISSPNTIDNTVILSDTVVVWDQYFEDGIYKKSQVYTVDPIPGKFITLQIMEMESGVSRTSGNIAEIYYVGTTLPHTTTYTTIPRDLTITGRLAQELGWKDNVMPFSSGNAGPSNFPAFNAMPNGMHAFQFAPDDYLYVFFHVTHDYALGTNAYPHVHFLSSLAGVAGEIAEWEFTYGIATGKVVGHPAGGTFAVQPAIVFSYTYEGTEAMGEHIIAECSDLQAFDLIQPDAVVYAKVKLTNNTTVAGNIFGICCDLHYQTVSESTKFKASPFD